MPASCATSTAVLRESQQVPVFPLDDTCSSDSSPQAEIPPTGPCSPELGRAETVRSRIGSPAPTSEPLLHDHRRHRDSRGRREGVLGWYQWRPLWRLWLLSAEGPAGFHLESGSACKWSNGKARICWRGQARAYLRDWKYDGPGLGKGWHRHAERDGKVVDSHAMPRSLPITAGMERTFNVGVNTTTPVDPEDYQVPVPFQRHDQQADREAGPDEEDTR